MALLDKHKKYLNRLKFAPGMIVRIKLTNFVTYDKIELHASSKLNVILGPNGTGKSTFLCAVVLGLGGKPTIIGRSPNICDYIKRNRDHAITELELFNGEGRNYVITRKIMQNNTSTWTLNRQNVPFKSVEAVLQKFNIMINNLCQILPQDRVQDFAKMDKKQLLEATQRAVGDGELFRWFEKMKSYRNQLLNDGQDLEETKRKFEIESQKVKSMEGDVKSHRRKKEILDEIAMMKKKEAWLVFEAKNEERHQVTNELKALAKEMEKTQKQHKPFLKAIEKVAAEEEELSHKISGQENAIDEINQKIRRLVKVGMQAKGNMAAAKEALQTKLKSIALKNQKLEELQSKRQKICTDMPRESEHSLKSKIFFANEQIEKCNGELSALRNQEKTVEVRFNNFKGHVIANEHKLAQCSNTKNKKLELLSNNQDAYEAYQWLNVNRNQFSYNIYGPMFIEMNVNDQSKAKYVEQTIPGTELVAFVCENSQDMSKLMKILKDEKGLRINAVCSGISDVPARGQYLPQIPIQNLRKYGFNNYLIDLFDAPEPILHWLCKQHNFHNIPVGNATVDQNLDSIPTVLRRYFSAEQVYTVVRSRFSENVTKSAKYIKDANLLRFSVDHNLIRAIEEELNNKRCNLESAQQELSGLKRRKQEIEVKCNEAKNEKREYARILETLKSLVVRRGMIDEEIQQLEETVVDIDAERANTDARIHELVDEMIQAEKQILGLLKDSAQLRAQVRLRKKEAEILAWRVRERQKQARQIEIKVQKAQEAIASKEEELSRIRAESKNLLKKAKEATDGIPPDAPEFVTRFKEEFEKYSNNLEALQDQIGEKSAMARCIEDSTSSRVLAEYEEKMKLLEELQKKLSTAKTRTSTIHQQTMELRERWLSKMQDLLATINGKFVKCFEYLQCCGTVELDLSSDPEAIENYGLNIKVKFRAEGDLQALDPFTQSGGERSLSTAIFLLSLQSVINVPFRFVDEINQGMDAYNEVRVYYLISCAVSQEKSAQYWLITPKLIEETRITLDTTIHVIYSGDLKKNEDLNMTATPNIGKPKIRWSKETYFENLGITN